jgi:hypothetical protein
MKISISAVKRTKLSLQNMQLSITSENQNLKPLLLTIISSSLSERPHQKDEGAKPGNFPTKL